MANLYSLSAIFTPIRSQLPHCCISSGVCRDVALVLNVSVSRRFLERLGLKEFGKIQRLGFISVLRVQCLGLEDITSQVSGFVTLGLVNIHALHQACGYMRKKVMDLTRKKQVVK